MSSVTVRDFAAEVKIPVDLLLSQLKEAGVTVKDEASALSEEDKRALLAHLQAKKGASKVSTGSEPKKITLKRKTTTELKLGGGRGAPSKTVSIEVRKKRTFVKPDLAAQQAAEAEAAKQAEDAAAAEAKAKADAEAEQAAKKAAEAQAAEAAEAAEAAKAEQAAREAEEAAARERAEAEAKAAQAAAAEKSTQVEAKPAPTKPVKAEGPPAPVDQARVEAAASRNRAAENLRRAAEMAKKEKENKVVEQRERRTARQELHVAKGKGGKRDRKRGGAASRRAVRVDTKHGFEKPTAPVVREVAIPEAISVGDLANGLAVKAGELVKALMKMGVMATINQVLDQDTAVLLVEEMGHKAKIVSETDHEDSLLQAAAGEEVSGDEESRAPVVTIMGHVDHGKTSLLDYIRKTRVAAGEAGGITQHIGAYHVQTDRGGITFLDTPGHAAFTRMRARGAQITDIVILIVAADDGVMPQTKEAIQHARAAGVPIVVAVTKIDKPDADIDKVKTALSAEEVIAEDWGGDIQVVGVSSHTGEGVDQLLDALQLQAEILELKAAVNVPARGTVVESSVEKGRGPVATVLVRSGTLKQGDVILTGRHFGRVRAMFDETGAPVKSAGPSMPVEVLGLSGAPDAGDDVMAVADERKARELAALRETKARETKLASAQAVRMEQVFSQMGEGGESKPLNLMIKADVQGSAQALAEALLKLPSEEVKVNIVSGGVGGISESDIDLALASQAIIIGFNTRADSVARRRIQDAGVDVRYYSIIYDVINDVSDAIAGLLGTETREQIVGIAQVRDVFRSSKLGAIAGCLVVEGEVRRSNPIRVLRDNVVIYEGELESLRRHKDDVQKVAAGTECGIGVKNYNDVKAGDQIEVYERVEVQRTVQAEA